MAGKNDLSGAGSRIGINGEFESFGPDTEKQILSGTKENPVFGDLRTAAR